MSWKNVGLSQKVSSIFHTQHNINIFEKERLNKNNLDSYLIIFIAVFKLFFKSIIKIRIKLFIKT